MVRRNTTNGDTPGRLTPQQLTAVDLLVSGKTLTETAEALGVGRPAVSDWVNHHPAFLAAMNSRRQELWEGVIDGLRQLLPEAVEVLRQELATPGPGRLTAAVHLLKCTGLYGQVSAPRGPVTAEDVEQAQLQEVFARTRTVLTADDVRLAEQSRATERALAALSAMGPLQS